MEDNYVLSGFKPAVTMCTFIKQVLLAQFRVNRMIKKTFSGTVKKGFSTLPFESLGSVRSLI